MKKIAIALLSITLIYACTNESRTNINEEDTINKVNQEKQKMEQKDMYPLANMYGEDSVDAEGNIVYVLSDELNYGENKEVVPQEDSISGRKYRLGPRPDIPFSNQFGDDSITPEGDFVYPSRDTIWIEAED
jgi:hypothetical protein